MAHELPVTETSETDSEMILSERALRQIAHHIVPLLPPAPAAADRVLHIARELYEWELGKLVLRRPD